MNPWEEDETFLARWLANNVDEKEKESFEQSEEGKKYLAIVAASERLSSPAYNEEEEWQKFREQVVHASSGEEKTSRKSAAKINPLWAGMAIAASLLIFFFIYLNISQPETYTAAAAEIRNIDLPDGSTVKLSSNSNLSYEESNGRRKLTLTGEAYFNVQEGDEFTVNTAVGTIRVLGTTFNIRQRGDVLGVSCFSGKVGVTGRNGGQKELIAGESVQIINERFEEPEVKPGNQPAWMEGISQFSNVPVTVALEELEAIYGLRIERIDRYPDIRYTGSFPHDDLEAAVRLVLDPLDADYTLLKNENKLIIKSEP
jgi:transmembrane sensor